MIRIKNLSKIYNRENAEVKALDHVSVNFGEKGMVFVVGKSGSGKSTLLNLLGGLDKPTSGEIVIDGRSGSDFKESDFDAYRNTYVGFIFQEYHLMESDTVGANVAIALELQGKKADRQAIDKILRKLELTDENGETLYARRINELSGGQKQRVAIARALIKDPKIILADEPTGALDSQTGKQLYEQLKELSKERPVVVVSHDRKSAETYGDRIIELSDGKVIKDSDQTVDYSEKGKEAFQFGKFRLSFRRAFAMGAGALKFKKVRLFLSIVLAVISFSFFGFTFTASKTSSYRTELQACYDNGIGNIVVESDNDYFGHGGWGTYPLTTEQIAIIEAYNKKYHNGAPIMIDSGSVSYLKHMPEEASESATYAYYELGLSGTAVIGIDPLTGADDLNLRPDERFLNPSLCRLPQTETDLAITDLKADMFIRFGYREQDGSVTKIKTPDDLIGKRLGDYVICGVYSTEFDRTYFQQFDRVTLASLEKSDPYHYNLLYSLLRTKMVATITDAFCKNRYTSLDKPYSVVIKLSGNIENDLKLFEDLNYKTEEGKLRSVQIGSVYWRFMRVAHFFQDYLVVPFRVIAILSAGFSALLMMNFLTVSLDFRKREIGILRALGASKKDIMGICLSESLIIASVDSILSVLTVAILCGILNTIFLMPVFRFGVLSACFMFALCFGVAALSTILPVIRTTRKKPIDIINNK